MRICFFGESFVNGFGDPTYQGWVGRLCAMALAQGYPLTAYNCGVRRATSDLIHDHFLGEAERRLPPEHHGGVVFSYGANDSRLEHGHPVVPFQRQMDNTRALLVAATNRWPALMVAPPQPRDGQRDSDADARSQGMKGVCAELGVPFFDTGAADLGPWYAEAAAGDGAHPGAGGYGALAALVDSWSAWRRLLDQLRS